MPYRTYTTDFVNSDVIRSIQIQAINRIIKNIGQSHIFDESNILINDNDFRNNRVNESKGGISLSDTKVNVTVTNNFNTTGLKYPVGNYHNKPYSLINRHFSDTELPFFSDEERAIKVYEYKAPINIILEFNFLFKDKEIGINCLNLILKKYPTNNVDMLDSLYSVKFPTYLIDLLKYIHEFSDETSDFLDYLKNNTTKEIITQKAPDEEEDIISFYAYKTIFKNIIGTLEHSLERVEPVEKETVTDLWTLSFTYTLQLFVPDMFYVYYPTTIDNKPIPDNLIPQEDHDLREHDIKGSYRDLGLEALKNYLGPNTTDNSVFIYPFYEDIELLRMRPRYYFENYRPILFMPFTFDTEEHVDENQITYTQGSIEIDLENILPDVAIHDTVLEIMKKHNKVNLLNRTGLYTVEFLVDGIPYNDDENIIIAEGNDNLRFTVKTRHHVNKRWHLLVSEVTTLDVLTAEHIDLVDEYKYFLSSFIAKNLNSLIRHRVIRQVPQVSFIRFIQNLIRNQLEPLVKLLNTLIKEGYMTGEIIYLLSTPYLFAQYILETKTLTSNLFIWDILKPRLVQERIVTEMRANMADVHLIINSRANSESYLRQLRDANLGARNVRSTPPARILNTSIGGIFKSIN